MFSLWFWVTFIIVGLVKDWYIKLGDYVPWYISNNTIVLFEKVTLDPSHPAHSLWTVALRPTLQITEHKNSQTQEQFFPPGRIPPEQHITHPGTVHL